MCSDFTNEVIDLDLLRLQQKIKKTLEDNSFKVVKDFLTKEKFVVISNFGDELSKSTFFIDKKMGSDDLMIGANIALSIGVLTKSMINRIQLTSARHNISCSPVKYNHKDDEGVITIQVVYSFLKFNEKNFMLYINNFKDCIQAVYSDVQRYLQHQETQYLDLSMFESADWTVFDPYTYIMERDKRFNGSWDNYIQTLKKNLDKKEKLAELLYVEMCKSFEDQNNIPIDLACDFIIDKIMQHVNDDKSDKVVN